MFYDDRNFTTWHEMTDALQGGKAEVFSKLLHDNMVHFTNSKDELRLLFYIGKDYDEAIYKQVLTYLDSWKTKPIAQKQERCEAYLYALQYSLPPKIAAAKPYLAPLFKETVGYGG